MTAGEFLRGAGRALATREQDRLRRREPGAPGGVARSRAPARGAAAHFDDSLEALPELDRRSSARDRGLANELVVGTIKRRGSLDAVLGAFAKAPLARDERARCSRRCAWRPSSSCSSTACRPTPSWTTRWRWSRAQGRARQGLRQRRAAQGGGRRGRRASATLSEGDGMRAWAVRYSCPVWMVRLLRPRARRRGGGAVPRRRQRAARALPAREHAARGPLPAARAALAAAGFTDARRARSAASAAVRRAVAAALARRSATAW